jgi:hypothetical protein
VNRGKSAPRLTCSQNKNKNDNNNLFDFRDAVF